MKSERNTNGSTSKLRPAILLSLLGVMLASLSACGTSPVKDGSTGRTDLDVLVLGVETMAKNREPAGDIKRAEDAATNEQAWALLLDLEDVDWLHEQDKANIVDFVNKAVQRIKQSMEPCSTWDRMFNLRECR